MGIGGGQVCKRNIFLIETAPDPLTDPAADQPQSLFL